MTEIHACPPHRPAEPTHAVAPLTDRREAVRTLGAAGLAVLAALGLKTTTDAAKHHTKGARQRRREARRQARATRQERRRTESQASASTASLSGESTADADPANKLLLFGGGFLGLTKVSAAKEIPGRAFDAVVAKCPPPAFGEQIVAIGGGYAGQILNDKGFQLGITGPSQDNGWLVSALNTSDSKLTLSVDVLCARFQR